MPFIAALLGLVLSGGVAPAQTGQEGDEARRALAPLEQTDAMFQLAQQVQSTGAAQAMQQIALRLSARAAGAEDLALERRDLTERRDAVRTDTALDAATRRRLLDEIDTALLVNGDRLARGFPDWRSITAPAPVSIKEARSLLAEGEALVAFHQGEDYLFVWLVAPDRVIWHRVAFTRADAAALVATFRADMGLSGTLRGATALKPKTAGTALPAFNRALAANLYELLFGPFKEQLAAYPHLRMVPDGAWLGLPFAALLTSYGDATAPSSPALLREASWLVRQHAITVMPSVVSLRALAGAAAHKGGTGTLLAVGDPVFSGTESAMEVSRSGGSGDGVDVSALAPLPGTRREVEAIARSFPEDARVLLGTDATEAAIRSADLSDRDVIVFATHGLIAGELQGLAEPALALTPPAIATSEDDGLLTAGEVAGLTLSADWVVLSACNTAAGDGAGAEGLSGLARAFFAAGAQSLLVSHWPVRDDAAARLTAAAFEALRAEPELRKAEAMRRSMLALMADESDATLAHPLAWAPFFVVGGGT